MGKHDTTSSRDKTRRGGTQRLQLVLAGTLCLVVCSLLMNVLVYVHLTAAITELSRRLAEVEGRQDSHRSTGDLHPLTGNNPDVKTTTGQNEISRDPDNSYQSLVDVPGWSNQSALRRRRGINLHTLSEVYRAYEEKERRSRMYTSLGCWRDRYPDRAIPTLERTDPRLDGHYISRQNPIEKCYQVALSRGFTVFAVQHDGECFGSADARNTYRKYGPSTACASDGEGGRRANEVYQIKVENVCESNPCQNHGTCHNGGDHYICRCPRGWGGVHCETVETSPHGYQGMDSRSSSAWVHIAARSDSDDHTLEIKRGHRVLAGHWETVRSNNFHFDQGKLEVMEEGDYYLYSQVQYLECGNKPYTINHTVMVVSEHSGGPDHFLTCVLEMYGFPPYKTCFTAGMRKLYKKDIVYLYVPCDGCVIALDHDTTFFGLVKLS
ncbi:uncharacterized protein LOC144927613 isoform X2 [Branchiostoma floridae x Branchiostoma belcheri]